MILVTGATGRVGDAVVRALTGLGQPVRALVRKGSAYYWLNDTGCSFFFGDLRDPTSVRRALRDVQYVIACSSVGLETRDNNLANVVVQGHRDLFAAAAESNVERVVLVSCMGADPDSSVSALHARAAAEQALVELDIDYTILRACTHEVRFLELAWRIHDNGALSLPGSGDNELSVLPTRDLALMAAASLDLASVHNTTLSVGGERPWTARAALELACEIVGVEPSIRTIPQPLVSLGARLGRPVRRYANRLAEQAEWFQQTHIVDPAEMTRIFQIPLTPLRDAMLATNETLTVMRDPQQRAERMVHPQFYATIYEPGKAKLEDLPDGPLPRQD